MSRRSRVVWMVGVLVTLAGLLGMHGLAEHGTGPMGAEHAAMADTAIGTATANQDHPGGHAVTTTAVAQVASAWASAAGGDGGMGMGAAMCLAVLLVGLAALVLARYGGRGRPLPWWTPRVVLLRVGVGRPPDPPNLYVLSIQRC